MPRTSKRSLIDQIAAQAQPDQAIVTITLGKGKALLPVQGKINAKGDFVYVSLPAIAGLFKKGTDGNLTPATPGDDAEAVYFPELAQELATLRELAKKYGFTLATTEGGAPVKRTRAPRGTGAPRPAPKAMPAVGDKFVAQKDGIIYTIQAVDGKTLKMTGEDGSKKSVTYSGIFWRWHTAVG